MKVYCEKHGVIQREWEYNTTPTPSVFVTRIRLLKGEFLSEEVDKFFCNICIAERLEEIIGTVKLVKDCEDKS